MAAPRTPSTSDYSTLETQQRNDHTSTENSISKYPEKSNDAEFEVEKLNTDDTKSQQKGQDNKESKNDDEWDDLNKKKNVNSETQNKNDSNTQNREKTKDNDKNNRLGNEEEGTGTNALEP